MITYKYYDIFSQIIRAKRRDERLDLLLILVSKVSLTEKRRQEVLRTIFAINIQKMAEDPNWALTTTDKVWIDIFAITDTWVESWLAVMAKSSPFVQYIGRNQDLITAQTIIN